MKKLVVIGKGTAGSQSAIHFDTWMPNCEVEWHHDPSIPVQAVGEGANLVLPKNLFRNMDFCHSDLHKIFGTFKLGIFKKNWGENGKEFFHHFTEEGISYHFNAVALQDYIYNHIKNNRKIKIVEKNSKPEEVDADYIVDCSGKPQEYSEFHMSEFIPVNSVHVTQCFWDHPRFQYTLTIARPYGWVFGIPLTNRCSIGYMYNKDINTLEEVKEDVKEIFKEYNLTPSDTTNSFSFKNYFRKSNFTNRISHNGNASFFLEPLEATSIFTMDAINRKSYDFWLGKKSLDQINQEYSEVINEIETMIMMHYYAGSIFKTKFWNFAKERATIKIENAIKHDKKFLDIVRFAQSVDTLNYCRAYENEYGSWWAGSFKENLKGLGLRI